MAKKKDTELATQPEPKARVLVSSSGLTPNTLDEMWRMAKALSLSTAIPERYQNNEGNCFVAIELSMRTGVSWFALMQHVYVVHGNPAMDAALVVALTNQSGIFVDPIEYEVEGKDARKKDFRVRAYAVRKSTGKKLEGPWIDYQLVEGEGWDKAKKGFPSKWVTMPDQMFHYRAAAWFQRRYCPEVAMGMLTTDEAADMPVEPRHVESTVVEKGVQGLKDRLAERDEAQDTEEAETVAEPVKGEPEETQDRKDEAQRQKDALSAADANDSGAEPEEGQQPEDGSSDLF